MGYVETLSSADLKSPSSGIAARPPKTTIHERAVLTAAAFKIAIVICPLVSGRFIRKEWSFHAGDAAKKLYMTTGMASSTIVNPNRVSSCNGRYANTTRAPRWTTTGTMTSAATKMLELRAKPPFKPQLRLGR